MMVPFLGLETGKSREAIFNVTTKGPMLGVALLSLTHGFLDALGYISHQEGE